VKSTTKRKKRPYFFVYAVSKHDPTQRNNARCTKGKNNNNNNNNCGIGKPHGRQRVRDSMILDSIMTKNTLTSE